MKTEKVIVENILVCEGEEDKKELEKQLKQKLKERYDGIWRSCEFK